MNFTNYRFLEKEYPVSGVFSNVNINSIFQNFLREINVQKGQIGIITKVKTIQGNIFTIGKKIAIKPYLLEDNTNFINHFIDCSNQLDSRYTSANIISIIFAYSEISDTDYLRINNLLLIENKILDNSLEDTLSIELPYKIPLNNNYFNWGELIKKTNNEIKITNITFNPSLREDVIILVKSINSKENLVSFINIKKNIVLFYFTDFIKSGQLIRYYKNKQFVIENNKIVLILNNNNQTKYISKTLKSLKNFNKSRLITLDVETYLNNNKEMYLYCLSLYNGSFKRSYFLNDFNTIDGLLNKVFKDLFTKSNNRKTIFIHNSSEFDLIFLLKHLVQLSYVEVNPIIRENKFINLEIKYSCSDSKTKKYSLNFRDSILLLPISLDKLAKAFNIKFGKGIFPYFFVNEQNLDYKGMVPEYKYFDSKKITTNEYEVYKNKYQNKLWILKKEAISYCEQDCVVLYKILEKFGNQIYKEFKVDIYLTPTLPSLAFRIFRTHFLKNRSIPILTDKFYRDLVNAFYGGHCDVYIPKIQHNNIYCYDVNGLYPFAMKNFKFPTKILTNFIGDITKENNYKKMLEDNKALGIFKVKVKAPLTLINPLLPRKMKGTTVYGVGTWTGWYFSEELKMAKSFGYTIEILSGYIFKNEFLFTDYVNNLNKMKENSEKESPNYLIAKLLLNSLYGRFSMSPLLLNHKILELSSKEYNKFIEEVKFENIESELKLGDKALISYKDLKSLYTSSLNINIAIGLATSSYARIHMSQFKNNVNYNLFYTDTDSIFIDQPLADNFIDSKKLGLMKLEYCLTDFVAIAPKVYGGVKINGDQFTKVKGFKDPVSFDQLKSLLHNNEESLILTQQKWFNEVSNSLIKIKESNYNLKPTNIKREIIIENNTFIATKNKVFND